MSPRRILLTGAEGFVGHHMLAALRTAFPGAHVTAGVRNGQTPPGFVGADSVAGFDLLSRSSVAALVDAARPDACIHLAAFSDVGGSFADPDAAWAINVDGTRHLAATLLREVPACILLNAGSADIYGLSFQDGGTLDEQAPIRPANPYAAAKAAADIALGEMALRGLRVIRMRPLNHIGPGQSERFAVASFARQVARIAAGLQAPVIEAGSLQSARMFLDVRDVCSAYVAVLRAADTLPQGAVFNLCSDTSRTLRQVLDDLLELSGVAATVRTMPAVVRPLDITSTSCSSAALRGAVGWQPVYAWRDTLTDTLRSWSEKLVANPA